MFLPLFPRGADTGGATGGGVIASVLSKLGWDSPSPEVMPITLDADGSSEGSIATSSSRSSRQIGLGGSEHENSEICTEGDDFGRVKGKELPLKSWLRAAQAGDYRKF